MSKDLIGRDLGNQYALHALHERRAEMAGEMTELQRRLSYLRQAVVSLDATLAIMAPGFDPTTIRPKKPYRKAKLFGAGKLNQLILDALRRGARPMTTHEVTEAIGAAMGFGPDATTGLKSRVRSNLLYLSRVRGTVVKDGERAGATWSLTAMKSVCESNS